MHPDRETEYAAGAVCTGILSACAPNRYFLDTVLSDFVILKGAPDPDNKKPRSKERGFPMRDCALMKRILNLPKKTFLFLVRVFSAGLEVRRCFELL